MNTKYTKNKAQKTELGKNFTLNLKYFRNRRGWTQKELADKLGNSQQAIWFWEMGGKSPRLQDLDAVCDALDVSIIELFGLQDEAFEFVAKNPLAAPKKQEPQVTSEGSAAAI
jgi:transcriptional regulator with XRE-family HTH domain